MCQQCYRELIRQGISLADINNLPDEAFAVLEPDYRTGKTSNKNARHLAHHKAGVKAGRSSTDLIDRERLMAALSAVKEIEPVTGSISVEELRKRAGEHLIKHTGELKISLTRSPQPDPGSEAPGGNHKGDSGASGIIKPPKLMMEKLSAQGRQTAECLAEQGIVFRGPNSMGARLEASVMKVDFEEYKKSMSARLELGDAAKPGIDDIIPKPEDYIYADFRALSKAVLEGRWLNFSIGDVLKKSTQLLNGVTLYKDHWTLVDNYAGKVIKTTWDDTADPNGINARCQVDAKAEPKLARGLMSDMLGRTSVNVWFEWVQSHDDLDSYQFWEMLGKEVEDKIVTFDVTLISGYGELSFVWMGADKNAKRVSGIERAA
jgi:hypothetical protein